MSVVTYFTKLKGLWDELSSLCAIPSCTCGAMTEALHYQQRQRTMKFLMGLNESYFAVCGQILLMDPLPSVNRAYSLVLQEERQREVSFYKPTTLDVAALMVKENLNAQERKNYKNAGKKKGEKNERPKCTHCRWEGHTIDTCYRIHGYPPGHRLHKASSQPSANQVSLPMIENKASSGLMLSQEQYQQLLSLLSDANKSPMAHNVGSTSTMSHLSGKAICLSSSLDHTPWNLDSGATDHMVRSLSYLTSSTPIRDQTISSEADPATPCLSKKG
ncbi:hypothetical protein RHSIM_Rhsim10G0073900 [Rhododendron simsii]|uniref:Uncharacterized protein n=1 Tax=Rhododendron simsii TaxID=118357 RepID=A0A834GCF5_RHOSS|nr:hypothetical protein RHSIM_Rhsim10G0073900 [Rhododendron simsii]